ncbi:hypothetical protein [Marinilactibacillus psychrotolerans]
MKKVKSISYNMGYIEGTVEVLGMLKNEFLIDEKADFTRQNGNNSL